MAESIEGRNSGAHQRCGFGGIERFRHAGQRFDRRDHEFLIAAVVADPADHCARTIDEVTSSACGPRAVLTSVPADANSLTFFPAFHSRSDLINDASNLVSWNTRIRNAWNL